ncbi:MAG: hypothetical protein ACYC7E_21650 [Armatimonadota bacterium]
MDNKNQRKKLTKKYREQYQQISALLFHEDPLGINGTENTDEYDPEVGSILPHLKTCKSVDEVRRVVYEEFIHWFGADMAGSEDKYDQIAKRIWAIISNIGN